MLKKFSYIALLVLFLPSTLMLAEEKNRDGSITNDRKTTNDSFFKIPAWLQRTNYGAIIETGKKPRFYLETVQPLYQSADKENTFFTHDRIALQDGKGTYSAGLGFRRLLLQNSLLAGINTFFDYQNLHKHYRQGVGLEMIVRAIELRVNSYFGLSPKRLVEETPSTKFYEKAVNGGDAEIGGQIPYLPWFKVFGSFYRYDYKYSDDIKGWQERLEFTPFKFITLNYLTHDDNKGDREHSVDGRIALAFDTFSPKSIFSAVKLSKVMYHAIDIKEHTLDRVERNFSIQIERSSVSKVGNIIVEIKRGT